MTPARLAEIRAYIQRLDLDQLPGWTVEQRIIADLWEGLEDAWNEGFGGGYRWASENDTEPYATPPTEPPVNPYRDGDR